MERCRVFYVITVKSGVKKKDLRRFLEKEWIPALKSTPGCIEVELLDEYRDRAGYCISEVWESQETHIQNSTNLWGKEKPEIWKKLGEYGVIDCIWNCKIVMKI
ncbi:MAG: hypothetical protein DRN61_01215 [Thaumarchaeota archaeon]|nr:MAG: hypothetical protein DRP77_01170 [Candidatus Poribacteria bacterium]RLG05233.1 MAG: hypothetical protein DRN61_01215 [Nitrososphaerota archaeon]